MSETTDLVALATETASESASTAVSTTVLATATGTSSAATSTSTSSSDGSPASIGVIIGLTVGALALIAMGAFFVVLRRRYLRKMGITDPEAHLHEVTERAPGSRRNSAHFQVGNRHTIIEIRTARRPRRPRSEPWVEPPPTYQEAHADGVPAYEVHDSGSDQEHETSGSRSPLRSPRGSIRSLHLADLRLRSPISIRSFRIDRQPRTPRTPGSQTPTSLRSPMRSPMRSPNRSPSLSPVRQVNTAAEFDEETAREQRQRHAHYQ